MILYVIMYTLLREEGKYMLILLFSLFYVQNGQGVGGWIGNEYAVGVCISIDAYSLIIMISYFNFCPLRSTGTY